MALTELPPRKETDALGEVEIPEGSYWGAGTFRCRELFRATGRKIHPKLITAIANVKRAAAITNGGIGLLQENIVSAITQASNELVKGDLGEQIVMDALCGAQGVGLNINVNEVIAGRANEILEARVGDPSSPVHPDRHVNLCQSTADVFITSTRVAILLSLDDLYASLLDMERLLRRKSLEFERIRKPGRTSLRDSVPVTLGQEFNAYGSVVEKSHTRISQAADNLREINLGGTHVGTGYGTLPTFQANIVRNLSNCVQLELRQADDYFRLTSSLADFVAFSSSLRELALDLIKIAGDLSLLSSGPGAGLGEIRLPEIRICPSILLPEAMQESALPPLTEALSLVCYQVLGNDHAVSLAANAGQLESNGMTPVTGHNILESIAMLDQAIRDFSSQCLARVTADSERCQELLALTGAEVASLASHLGLDQAGRLAERSRKEGRQLKELLREEDLLSGATIDELFHHRFMTTPSMLKATDADSGEEDSKNSRESED